MKVLIMACLGLILLAIIVLIPQNNYLQSCCPPPPRSGGYAPTGACSTRTGTANIADDSSKPPTLPGQRPALGIGLQPLFLSALSMSNVVEPWEVWWSRVRGKYLSFREQIQWLKSTDTGGTTNLQVYPAYGELIKILAEAAADKDMYISFRAAIALGKAQDCNDIKLTSKAAIDTLKKLHESESRAFIRNNILLALGLAGDASCSTTIIDVIKDKSGKEDALSRCYAALAAGYFTSPSLSVNNNEDIIKTLRDTLSDKDVEVKCCACISLGNLKDAASVPLLDKLLNGTEGEKKEQSQTRGYAALGLGRIGGTDALAALKKYAASNDNNSDIQSAVAVALGISNMPEAGETLIAMMRDKKKIAMVRGLAALSLGQLKDPNAYDAISEVLQKVKSNDADGLMLIGLSLCGNEKAKDDLRKILESKKYRPLLRAAAAIGLGLMKDTQAVPTIMAMLSDEKQQSDIVLTPYLILSLGMIQDPRGVEILKKLWAKTEILGKADKKVNMMAYTNIAVALTMLGKRPDVIKALAEHIKSKNPVLMPYALHTLGMVGDKESSNIFIEASKNNHNPEICKALTDGIGFMLDKNTINPLDKVTADNIDVPMQTMQYILPIPVW